jgi:hypothetical protein
MGGLKSISQILESLRRGAPTRTVFRDVSKKEKDADGDMSVHRSGPFYGDPGLWIFNFILAF